MSLGKIMYFFPCFSPPLQNDNCYFLLADKHTNTCEYCCYTKNVKIVVKGCKRLLQFHLIIAWRKSPGENDELWSTFMLISRAVTMRKQDDQIIAFQ